MSLSKFLLLSDSEFLLFGAGVGQAYLSTFPALGRLGGKNDLPGVCPRLMLAMGPGLGTLLG